MNSIHDIKLKDIEGMNKKHITARIEEDFIYTLLIANDTNNLTEVLRNIITDHIVENNLVKLLEKVNKILKTNEIKDINDLMKVYV